MDPLFDQLSARERKIIRKSFDPDAKFYHRSPQSSPRNHFRTTKDFSTQNSLPKDQNEKEKELTQDNDNESSKENNDDEAKNDNVENKSNETEIKNESKSENNEEINDSKSISQEESNENPQDTENNENNDNNSQNKDSKSETKENSLNNQSEEEEEDILSRKLYEVSMKHSIQQKILIQEAEVDLKKSNYSPVSLRSFIIKSNNFKQKRQGEIMRIYEKYGSTYKTNKQITQRNRSKSFENKTSNQNKYRSSHALNLTPRLSMFASNSKLPPPNPRFSVPATLTREQEELNVTGQIKLPPMSQSQQISNNIPLFDTQTEKVYQSNLNDPFNVILSQQELVTSPSIRLNVKPPPPPAKKIASPRKQGKKKGKTSKLSRSSKMSRKRGKSALSTEEPQEPQEPPPPPIKRHVLTMRTSMIPKNGIIDVDKRNFLDFLNDKEEEIEVEVKIEENPDAESQTSSKSKKSKSRNSKSRSKLKSRASSKK